MRQAFILALLVLVFGACDSNYDPPKAYGIGTGYGSNGRAYAAQQSPSVFILLEIVEEEDVTRQPSDAIVAFDVPNDLSEAVLTCIDTEGGDAFAPYCLCLEENGTLGAEDPDCICEFLICVDPMPNPDQDTAFLPYCLGQGFLNCPAQ